MSFSPGPIRALNRPAWLVYLLFIFPLLVMGQQDANPPIKVSGKVIQKVSVGFGELLVINKRTGAGIWGEPDGTFETTIRKNDTLLISVRGYRREVISFVDSVYKPHYNIEVQLQQLTIVFDKPIIIRPDIEQSEIKKQQDLIGSYMPTPVFKNPLDYVFSPFSALYYAFSKKEKEKREYYKLVNEKSARDALKTVIQYYIQNDLFFLQEDEIEQFIDYCHLPMDYIKSASLYKLGVSLKACYKDYEKKQGH